MSKWELKALSDLVQIKGGKRLPKGHIYAQERTSYPYLRVVDFHNCSIKDDELKYITRETAASISRYTISSDDVYISIAGTIGLVGTIPTEYNDAFLTENAAKLVIMEQEMLDKYYLTSFLVSPKGKKQIKEKTIQTSQPKLALFRTGEIIIPLPPLDTQKKIAKTLDTASELLAMRKQQLAELDNLIKSTFYDMFGDPVKNEKGLEMVKLIEVCDLNMGQSPKSSSYNQKGEGLPFYQGNADFGELHPETRYYCNEPTKIAEKDDILLSVRAPIGALNIATQTCCIGRGLSALSVRQNIIDNNFLYHVLKLKHTELNHKGTGSTFKAINKINLSNIKIPSPSLNLQTQFSKIITKIEEQKALVKKAIDETQYLLDSLMCEYFE